MTLVMKLLKKLFFFSLIAGAVAFVVKKVSGSHEDEWAHEHGEHDHAGHDHAAPEHGPDDTNP